MSKSTELGQVGRDRNFFMLVDTAAWDMVSAGHENPRNEASAIGNAVVRLFRGGDFPHCSSPFFQKTLGFDLLCNSLALLTSSSRKTVKIRVTRIRVYLLASNMIIELAPIASSE